jgi:2-iminoacetate synthase ThiH
MRRLKATDAVGVCTLFQEIHHLESFRKSHPDGLKADDHNRITIMDRAQIGGLGDVGLGALLRLYDSRFEALALLQHSQHVDKTYGTGSHTRFFSSSSTCNWKTVIRHTTVCNRG